MKTLSRLLILGLVLCLLCGCDLRNRRPSSEFIPATQPTESTAPPETESVPPTETAPVKKELRVLDVYSKNGTYIDGDGRTIRYSYLVPMVDSDSDFAAACNTEIDKLYRAPADEQLALMDARKPLTVDRIDYETHLIDNVLTLYVTLHGVDAADDSYSVYSFDKRTGKEADHKTLLKLGGFEDEESFLVQAAQAIQARFEKDYADQQDELGYDDALDRTLREDNYGVEMPMHLDKEGRLVIAATLYDLARQPHPVLITLEPPEAEE